MLNIDELKKEYIEIIKELAEKGLLRLAINSKGEIEIPPKFPGKPLSEYLKEIRE